MMVVGFSKTFPSELLKSLLSLFSKILSNINLVPLRQLHQCDARTDCSTAVYNVLVRIRKVIVQRPLPWHVLKEKEENNFGVQKSKCDSGHACRGITSEATKFSELGITTVPKIHIYNKVMISYRVGFSVKNWIPMPSSTNETCISSSEEPLRLAKFRFVAISTHLLVSSHWRI